MRRMGGARSADGRGRAARMSGADVTGGAGVKREPRMGAGAAQNRLAGRELVS